RAARSELVVARALGLGLVEIAMLGNTVDDASEARAADALAARRRDLDAVRRERGDHRLALRDPVYLAGAREPDVERDIARRSGGGRREVLAVQSVLGPAIAPCRYQHPVHEALWAAHVQVRIAGCLRDHRLHVELLVLGTIVEMEPDTFCERGRANALAKRR